MFFTYYKKFIVLTDFPSVDISADGRFTYTAKDIDCLAVYVNQLLFIKKFSNEGVNLPCRIKR